MRHTPSRPRYAAYRPPRGGSAHTGGIRQLVDAPGLPRAPRTGAGLTAAAQSRIRLRATARHLAQLGRDPGPRARSLAAAQHIPDLVTLRTEVDAWIGDRARAGAAVTWMLASHSRHHARGTPPLPPRRSARHTRVNHSSLANELRVTQQVALADTPETSALVRTRPPARFSVRPSRRRAGTGYSSNRSPSWPVASPIMSARTPERASTDIHRLFNGVPRGYRK